MDVVTFGETMISMTPNFFGPLDSVSDFKKRLAGAESNVAVGLARLGHEVAWISRLGTDPFGRFIYKSIRGEGVDVSSVKFDSEYGTGIYFKEISATGQGRAYYYRNDSAASHLSENDLNLKEHKDAKYLFVTGITPALSQSCRNATFHAIEEAQSLGMTVVFDPNVRLKLWSSSEAKPVLLDIASKADLVLPGIHEGELLTGYTDEDSICRTLRSRNSQNIVLKLGERGAYYSTEQGEGVVRGYNVSQVDEIGAGDAFATGLISGLLDNLMMKESVRRACAMGAIAVSGIGDYESLPTRQELEHFMGNQKTIRR